MGGLPSRNHGPLAFYGEKDVNCVNAWIEHADHPASCIGSTFRPITLPPFLQTQFSNAGEVV